MAKLSIVKALRLADERVAMEVEHCPKHHPLVGIEQGEPVNCQGSAST